MDQNPPQFFSVALRTLYGTGIVRDSTLVGRIRPNSATAVLSVSFCFYRRRFCDRLSLSPRLIAIHLLFAEFGDSVPVKIDPESAVALLDQAMALIIHPLCARNALFTNCAGELDYDAVFAAMKLHQTHNDKSRDASIQEDFTMRDKLVQHGVMQVSSCIELIQKKKQTESRRTVMESNEFAAFMRGCQQLRNGLFPRLAMLVDVLEEAFEFDPVTPLAVVTKLSGTVKDVCAFLKEHECALTGTRIRASDLTPRTKKRVFRD
jgi:hypothetical protein